jgi:hypothetical protein
MNRDGKQLPFRTLKNRKQFAPDRETVVRWLFQKFGLCAAVMTLACATAAAQSQPAASRSSASTNLHFIHADQDKEVANGLQPAIQQGRQKVEKFFGQPFKGAFEIEIYADRAAFDEYFRKRWKVPKTEAWMVASGVGDRLIILSPRVWKTQAVEHDPANAAHIRELVTHELVHVYHGQHNPRPDFDGMDDCGWFVEGLAVYVSGQLEASHRTDAREAIKAGKAPAKLADAWSGRYRYGVCGSMVEFVDKRYGRNVTKELLVVVSNEEALKRLGMTESEFLEAWKASVQAQN